MLYTQALSFLLSGILIVANIKPGALVAICGIVLHVVTKDNPFLAVSEANYHHSVMNCFKLLSVAGACFLIFLKPTVIVHRRKQKS